MTAGATMTTARKAEPFFTVKEGDGTKRRVVLDKFPYTLGRARDCDLVVDFLEVSRLHARFDFDHEQVTITDLGSTNGTYVNAVRLEPYQSRRLRSGDAINLANVCTLEFDDPAATATIPLVSMLAPGIRLEEATASVLIDGLRLDPPLSPGQFALLKLLMENEETVVTRETIRARVWNQGEQISEQTIDALVSRLRKRLEEADPSHEYIITRRGFGLMFRNKS